MRTTKNEVYKLLDRIASRLNKITDRTYDGKKGDYISTADGVVFNNGFDKIVRTNGHFDYTTATGLRNILEVLEITNPEPKPYIITATGTASGGIAAQQTTLDEIEAHKIFASFYNTYAGLTLYDYDITLERDGETLIKRHIEAKH